MKALNSMYQGSRTTQIPTENSSFILLLSPGFGGSSGEVPGHFGAIFVAALRFFALLFSWTSFTPAYAAHHAAVLEASLIGHHRVKASQVTPSHAPVDVTGCSRDICHSGMESASAAKQCPRARRLVSLSSG